MINQKENFLHNETYLLSNYVKMFISVLVFCIARKAGGGEEIFFFVYHLSNTTRDTRYIVSVYIEKHLLELSINKQMLLHIPEH
jgi:hypothetical protein